MRQDTYLARRNEQWVIEHVARLIAQVVIERELLQESRRALMRLLFGLLRFPRLTPGLHINLSFREGDDTYQVEMSEERLSLTRGPTALQYFPGCNHLRDCSRMLEGWERQHMLENWVPLFDDIMEPDTQLFVEDYSDDTAIDLPPLTDIWQKISAPVFFDVLEERSSSVPQR